MTRVLAVGFLVVLALPGPAPGADVDDLKATHEAMVKALNARDNQAFAAGFYDREVRFSPVDPFPSDIEKHPEDRARRATHWKVGTPPR